MTNTHCSTPKKVLILYPHAHEQRDAVSAIIRELTAMIGSNHSVTLISMDKPRKPAPAYSGIRGKLSSIIHRQARSLGYWAYLANALGQSIRSMRDTDVIISVDVPAGVRLVGVLPRLLSGNRIRLVSWVLDLYSMQVARRGDGLMPRNRVRQFWDNVGLRASTDVVVLGECMAQAVKAEVGKDATVIPLWKEPTTSTQSNLRDRYGIDPGAFVVMYSGNAGPNHPLAALVDAVESFAPEDNLLLLIAGRGSEIEKARAESGSPNIRFVDPVPDADVPALLGTGDLHVAVLDEKMTGTCVPSKAYSGMAGGKPCLFLGSAESQAALDIAGADAGSVLPTTNHQAIAAALREYATNPGLAARRGANALNFISTSRSKVLAVKKWDDFLTAT